MRGRYYYIKIQRLLQETTQTKKYMHCIISPKQQIESVKQRNWESENYSKNNFAGGSRASWSRVGLRGWEAGNESFFSLEAIWTENQKRRNLMLHHWKKQEDICAESLPHARTHAHTHTYTHRVSSERLPQFFFLFISTKLNMFNKDDTLYMI